MVNDEFITDEFIIKQKEKVDKYIIKKKALGLEKTIEDFLIITDKDSEFYGDICLFWVPDLEIDKYKVPDFVTNIGRINGDKITSRFGYAKKGFYTSINSLNRKVNFFHNRKFKEVIIGKSTKRILDQVFMGSDVEKITITGNIEYIGKHALYNCKKLEHFDFNKLKDAVLEADCFGDCRSLKEADLSNVKYIGDGVFDTCSDLKRVILPNCIKEIKQNTFADCDLREINIPDSVEIIGCSAFSSCMNLQSVVFGKNMKELHRYCFEDCGRSNKSGLSLEFKGNSIDRIDLYVFHRCLISSLCASEKIKLNIRRKYT